ncbi:unnamed protein product [Lathyrus oleraceus]
MDTQGLSDRQLELELLYRLQLRHWP